MDAACDSMKKVKMDSLNHWCFPEKDSGHTTQMVGAKLTKDIAEVSPLRRRKVGHFQEEKTTGGN